MEVSLEPTGTPTPPPRRKRQNLHSKGSLGSGSSSPERKSSPRSRNAKPERPSIPPRPLLNTDHKAKPSPCGPAHGASQKSTTKNETRPTQRSEKAREKQSPTKSVSSARDAATLHGSRSGDHRKARSADYSTPTGSNGLRSPTKKQSKVVPSVSAQEVARKSIPSRTHQPRNTTGPAGNVSTTIAPSANRERKLSARHETPVKPDPPLRPAVAPTTTTKLAVSTSQQHPPSRPATLPYPGNRNKVAPYSQLYGSTQSLPAGSESSKDTQRTTPRKSKASRTTSHTVEELSTSQHALKGKSTNSSHIKKHGQSATKTDYKFLKKYHPVFLSTSGRKTDAQTKNRPPAKTSKTPPERPAPPSTKTTPSTAVTKTQMPINKVSNGGKLRKTASLQTTSRQLYDEHIYMEVGQTGLHQSGNLYHYPESVDSSVDYPYVIMSPGDAVHMYMALDLDTADECLDYDLAESMLAGSKYLQAHNSETENEVSLSKHSQCLEQLHLNHEHLDPDDDNVSSAEKFESELDHSVEETERVTSELLHDEHEEVDESVNETNRTLEDHQSLEDEAAMADYDTLRPKENGEDSTAGAYTEGDYDRLAQWDDQSAQQEEEQVHEIAEDLERDVEKCANIEDREGQAIEELNREEESKLARRSEREASPSGYQSEIKHNNVGDAEEMEGERECDHSSDSQIDHNIHSSDGGLAEVSKSELSVELTHPEDEHHLADLSGATEMVDSETVPKCQQTCHNECTSCATSERRKQTGQRSSLQSSEELTDTNHLSTEDSCGLTQLATPDK